VSCGADIISRIIYSLKDHGLKTLQNKVVSTINTVIEDVCRKATIYPSDISYIMTAGNTVMAHLLLGISPRFIREAPYVPGISIFPLTRAAELGIDGPPPRYGSTSTPASPPMSARHRRRGARLPDA